jgi:hypothetical protein
VELALEHAHLVAKHHDLEVLAGRCPTRQQDKAKYPA